MLLLCSFINYMFFLLFSSLWLERAKEKCTHIHALHFGSKLRFNEEKKEKKQTEENRKVEKKNQYIFVELIALLVNASANDHRSIHSKPTATDFHHKSPFNYFIFTNDCCQHLCVCVCLCLIHTVHISAYL